jgi:hypothetical protein
MPGHHSSLGKYRHSARGAVGAGVALLGNRRALDESETVRSGVTWQVSRQRRRKRPSDRRHAGLAT